MTYGKEETSFYRFFSSWLSYPDLSMVVHEAVMSSQSNGPPDVILMSKLKAIKASLKTWLVGIKEQEGKQLGDLVDFCNNMDIVAENRVLSDLEVDVWSKKRSDLMSLEARRRQDLIQKSRIRWALEGDENTSFFHGYYKANLAKCRINGLTIGGQWTSNPTIIKKEALGFFRSKFRSTGLPRPSMCCFNIRKLVQLESEALVMPFTKEEVKSAVWMCGGDKAPGPDGFNFAFIKKFWGVLEEDFFATLSRFHSTGTISKGCGSSFIHLVPKVADPSSLRDYRPISLIGCISKVISKVLANRIKPVMDSIISESQMAFLSDRFILDGPLIINEVISWAKKNKKPSFIFKIDFEKAFDTLEWSFLDSVMDQMGFPSTWRGWVFGVLKSARASVLVNGSPTWEFQCSRGVRQGDPLSPFLFLIAIEAFNCMMERAALIGTFHGISLPRNGPKLTHLLFADDAIILGEWTKTNVKILARLLRVFHLSSGLKVNHAKCNFIGLNIDDNDVGLSSQVLHCQAGSLPFYYLGVEVGSNMKRIKSWKSVVDVFENRLSLWKAKHLSIGGRLVLIKSVLDSLPIYYFSIYKAPKKVLAKLESIRMNFLWGGSLNKSKIHWVRREQVTKSKDNGGLGLDPLENINLSLLAKWIWRYKVDTSKLWRRVIQGIHGGRANSMLVPHRKSLVGAWSSIANLEIHLLKMQVNLHHYLKASSNNDSGWCWDGDSTGIFSTKSMR
ncbi:hypothetical protein SSX86_026184 [Deinandra increscens subsp. villosa]|uniref:Reverse transcriptase domain-containing protein n=1 Tax=Deinandra increscens subsp. villosa TaxID=3103831 RepID=A0AAP0CKY8_9ASTR